ncbi:MAG: hypothetical protein JNL58_27980 [Planctomyces sp.]|nr:hypothetical protein [Planctomyces sp.]
MNAPPGYSPSQRYMVGKYWNFSLDSHCEVIANNDGSRFFASLEDARDMIPRGAAQIAFEPMDQFVELWSDENRQLQIDQPD